MRRLDIIVEGQSEREFISQLVAPYLEKCGVIESYYVSPIVIRTNPNNRGGMTKYSHLKDEILKSLSSSNPDLVVSTLIDFFRLPSHFPHPENLQSLSSDEIKAQEIQKCMSADINDSRFIPYIQLHEFEAFMFASCDGSGIAMEIPINEQAIYIELSQHSTIRKRSIAVRRARHQKEFYPSFRNMIRSETAISYYYRMGWRLFSKNARVSETG